MKQIKLKSIKPLLNYLVVTADKYTAEELAEMHGGIIRTDMVDQLKPYQTIKYISKQAENDGFKVDQLVAININRYGRSTQKKNSYIESVDEDYSAHIVYNVPTIEIDDIEYLKLGTNDIEFIITDFEEVEIKKSSIILEEKPKDLILPKTNIIK